MVTPKAKGILPEDHPLFVGVATGMAIDQDIIATLRMADLIIGIGFDPVECDKRWFADVEIVSIDSVFGVWPPSDEGLWRFHFINQPPLRFRIQTLA
jgi:hypothetical protein